MRRESHHWDALIVLYAHSSPRSFYTHLPFIFIKILARPIEDSAVVDLGLVVALWIIGGGESVGELVFRTAVLHLPACEVGFVVGDYGIEEARSGA